MSSEYEPLIHDKHIQRSIRIKTKAILDELEAKAHEEFDSSNHPTDDSNHETPAVFYKSWIRGEYSTVLSSLPSPRCRFFDRHGFLHIPSFSCREEIIAMKQHMQHLVDTQWDPNQTDNKKDNKKTKKLSVFRTDDKQIQEQGSDDYFLTSATNIHFFAESRAMTPQGDALLDCYQNENKILALNKAGHGIHLEPGSIFHTYTTSTKIRHLVRDLGWVDPCVPQSMYIFKQARVGGEVTSHQDSTFLYTSPKQSCLGLWLALDDATIENGCLWVRPGSHWEPTRVRFARNAEHFGQDVVEQRGNVARGDLKKSQMIFVKEGAIQGRHRQGSSSKVDDWVGKIPKVDGMTPWDGLLECGFIPVECKAGDLVVFPGELDHLSLPNVSERPRHTFQLHLVEGEGAGVTWAESNWLQYPKGMKFMRLNE
jgi:Protein involved in biosynthesis of mitomycin antibiotics/polyketide fumonisin